MNTDTFLALYEVRICTRHGVWLLTAYCNDREAALARCDQARRDGLVPTLVDRMAER